MGPDLFISTNSIDRDTVNLLNNLFFEAAENSVSDIHFQENDGEVRVRLRMPGGLVDHIVVPHGMARIVDDKIRSRAQLPPSERKRPLDGRMQLRYPDRRIDVRVAITPNVGGQLTVCRLLDQRNAARSLNDIDMTLPISACIGDIIDEPNGLFMVSGPTGSGKTTMLYAIINELNSADRHIITIEDPVEYQVPGISQINIDNAISFSDALRAVLRQDPDVILIGEIRDAETAQIAVSAAITGHLVLATVHANNAALAITRLLDLGVDPITLAAAFRGVSAQRLVRRIAGDPYFVDPTEVEVNWMAKNGIVIPEAKFAVPPDSVAYGGYCALFELIVADDRVRAAIAKQSGADVIYEAAAKQLQFETLAQDGVRLAMSGISSLDEVRRVTSTMDAVTAGSERLGNTLVRLGLVEFQDLGVAIDYVASSRREGRIIRIGDALIETGACSREELLEGMGHSKNAAMETLATMRKDGLVTDESIRPVLEEWHLYGGSLFERLIQANLCSWKDIYGAAGFSKAGNGIDGGPLAQVGPRDDVVVRTRNSLLD